MIRILILCFLIGHLFVSVGAARTDERERARSEDAIRELVLRDEVGQFAASSGTTVYLTVEGEDPAPSFLKRFRDLHRPVLGGSRARHESGGPTRPEFVYDVGAVTWADDDHAEMTASASTASPVSTSIFRYRVERREGKWSIVERVRTAEI